MSRWWRKWYNTEYSVKILRQLHVNEGEIHLLYASSDWLAYSRKRVSSKLSPYFWNIKAPITRLTRIRIEIGDIHLLRRKVDFCFIYTWIPRQTKNTLYCLQPAKNCDEISNMAIFRSQVVMVMDRGNCRYVLVLRWTITGPPDLYLDIASFLYYHC